MICVTDSQKELPFKKKFYDKKISMLCFDRMDNVFWMF